MFGLKKNKKIGVWLLYFCAIAAASDTATLSSQHCVLKLTCSGHSVILSVNLLHDVLMLKILC